MLSSPRGRKGPSHRPACPRCLETEHDKNGVSSYEIARGIGITQKSAWFMLHRIRDAMRTGTFAKLSGEVEVDETFIGGKARNMHAGRRAQKIHGRGPGDKAIAFGMVERGGEVRTATVDTRKRKDLAPIIKENIQAGSAIFSDELKSYETLEGDFQHSVINHAVEYVNGNVHTNTMENFWSLLKRGLHGTYISVEPFHCSGIWMNRASGITSGVAPMLTDS
jgi:transposase-like protein